QSAVDLHRPIQQSIRGQNTYDQYDVVYAVGGDLGDQRALATQAFCHALGKSRRRQITTRRSTRPAARSQSARYEALTEDRFGHRRIACARPSKQTNDFLPSRLSAT